MLKCGVNKMTVDFGLIGKRIATLRKERGWTQWKLAEKADLSNIYLSNIENNRSIPSIETLVRLCVALEVTPNDILAGSSCEEKNYMSADIIQLLNQCTPQEKRYISGIIKVLLAERE